MTDKPKQLNIRLTADEYREFKALCFNRRDSMTANIARYIRRLLLRENKRNEARLGESDTHRRSH